MGDSLRGCSAKEKLATIVEVSDTLWSYLMYGESTAFASSGEKPSYPGSSDIDDWPVMALLVSVHIAVRGFQAEHVLDLESP